MERDCYYSEIKYVRDYACKAAGLDPDIAGWKTAVDALVRQLADAQRALDAERESLSKRCMCEHEWDADGVLISRSECFYHAEQTTQLAALQAQLRQVEGQSKQQAEEAVIVFAKYTTLRQLVEALPVYKDVSISHRVDENDFETWKVWVDHNPLAECDTEGEANAIKGLLQYRATLDATTPAECPDCDGDGAVGSGGTDPNGNPLMRRCGCREKGGDGE